VATQISSFYPLDSSTQALAVVQALEQRFQLDQRGTYRAQQTNLEPFDWRLDDQQFKGEVAAHRELLEFIESELALQASTHGPLVAVLASLKHR
jgi:hypothetical protein